MYASSQYGEKIGTDSIADFPELKSGGRYERRDSYPFPKLTNYIFQFVKIKPSSAGTPWLGVGKWARNTQVAEQWSVSQAIKVLFLIGGLGCCLITMYRVPIRRRLLLFLFVCLILYDVALWIYPTLYMPVRYVVYTVAMLIALMLPMGSGDLQRFVSTRLSRPKIA
ncbi:MAG: hypothetical protein JKX85_13995 [Phycisphaeraceae bacterium]|nr:hypothetical protein [Phycisphaeraceae bacterium]